MAAPAYTAVMAGLILAVFLGSQGVQARPELATSEEVHGLSTSIVAGIVGVLALAVVVMLCAGNKKVNPGVNRTGPPEWSRSLAFKDEMNVGFTDYSEGIHTPTPYHVIRERKGQAVTDAARWGIPLSSGKHVFEVYWPLKKNRGHACCVGVGTEDVKLTKQGRCSLVGEHSQSWGLDLAKHRSIHFGNMQQRLLRGIPDRFFVYLDMDSGKIGFGEDVSAKKYESEFYGFICTGIPKGKTVYFMISMCAANEHVHVFYRGSSVPSGGYNLMDTPSPLQFSVDNLGNMHLVPPQAVPPSYMIATAAGGTPGQKPVAPAPQAQEGPFYSAPPATGGPLEF